MYRLFIDEFGHDNLNTRNDPNEQFLSLTGVVLELDAAHVDLTNRMNTLKRAAFGTDSVVLHRREIIDKKPPPFDALLDDGIREAFTHGLIHIVTDAEYTAITVLIDKKEHYEKYKVWRFQPYHYCLTAMLERYVMLLDDRGSSGDVMAEWRGKKPNMKLENAYIYVYKNGTPNMAWNRFQSRLSSGQLKIQKKDANIAGLQLADLLANPAGRDLICKKKGENMVAPFGTEVVKILYESKYHRNWRGIVKGCEQRYFLNGKTGPQVAAGDAQASASASQRITYMNDASFLMFHANKICGKISANLKLEANYFQIHNCRLMTAAYTLVRGFHHSWCLLPS